MNVESHVKTKDQPKVLIDSIQFQYATKKFDATTNLEVFAPSQRGVTESSEEYLRSITMDEGEFVDPVRKTLAKAHNAPYLVLNDVRIILDFHLGIVSTAFIVFMCTSVPMGRYADVNGCPSIGHWAIFLFYDVFFSFS